MIESMANGGVSYVPDYAPGGTLVRGFADPPIEAVIPGARRRSMTAAA